VRGHKRTVERRPDRNATGRQPAVGGDACRQVRRAINEAEQVTGLFTNLEEYLTVPFETTVLGVHVTVVNVDLTDHDQIVAICSRDDLSQAIPILDLPLPAPPPEGAEWIEAYRRWLG